MKLPTLNILILCVEHSFAWHKIRECLQFPCPNNQIPTYEYLPQREKLLEIYKRHGFEYRNIGFQNLSGNMIKLLLQKESWLVYIIY